MTQMPKMFTFTLFTLCLMGVSLAGWAGAQETRPPEQPPYPLMAQAEDAPLRPPEEGAPKAEVGELRINWQALQLSQEQREQMRQKRRDFQVKTAGIREELKFLEQDLRAALQRESADQAALDRLADEMAALKLQLSEAAVQNLLAIKALLTPQQLEKLADFQTPLPAELRGIRLTEEQRAQIHAIMQTSREQNQAAAEELRELRDELRDMLLRSQEVDPERLRQVQTEIADREATLTKARFQALFQMKAVLTPKQLKQLQRNRTVRDQRQPASRPETQ